MANVCAYLRQQCLRHWCMDSVISECALVLRVQLYTKRMQTNNSTVVYRTVERSDTVLFLISILSIVLNKKSSQIKHLFYIILFMFTYSHRRLYNNCYYTICSHFVLWLLRAKCGMIEVEKHKHKEPILVNKSKHIIGIFLRGAFTRVSIALLLSFVIILFTEMADKNGI